MRTALAFLLLAAPCSAQVTITVPINVTVNVTIIAPVKVQVDPSVVVGGSPAALAPKLPGRSMPAYTMSFQPLYFACRCPFRRR
jgi:hypothetical protein